MPRRALLISQVYPADNSVIGHHFADLASDLARQGWKVTVLTANRAYDNPAIRYPAREERGGASIRRLPGSSLGKRTLAHRLAGMVSFLGQAFVRACLCRRPDLVIVSTSPPMAGVLGWLMGALRRVPFFYWVMDLNPDQAIALGHVRADAWSARIFGAAQRRVLRAAALVVTLDSDMAARLRARSPGMLPPRVLPPWAIEEHLEAVPHADNPFRTAEGLGDRLVVMYSGNHSPAHPLGTFLDAAERLRGNPDIVFYFIGGGLAKPGVEAAVRERGLTNVRCRDFLPVDQVRYSLSAADLHLVAMGPAMVGCVHPSKAYGALALGRPLLLLGPARCHLADLITATGAGWRVDHGDAAGLAALLTRLATPEGRAALAARGASGRAAYERHYRAPLLRAQLTGMLDTLVPGRPQPPGAISPP